MTVPVNNIERERILGVMAQQLDEMQPGAEPL